MCHFPLENLHMYTVKCPSFVGGGPWNVRAENWFWSCPGCPSDTHTTVSSNDIQDRGRKRKVGMEGEGKERKPGMCNWLQEKFLFYSPFSFTHSNRVNWLAYYYPECLAEVCMWQKKYLLTLILPNIFNIHGLPSWTYMDYA